MLGDGWFIMPITVILSTFGSANGVCFSSGRLVYISDIAINVKKIAFGNKEHTTD